MSDKPPPLPRDPLEEPLPIPAGRLTLLLDCLLNVENRGCRLRLDRATDEELWYVERFAERLGVLSKERKK